MQYTYSYSIVYSLNRGENCVHIMQGTSPNMLSFFCITPPILILPVFKLHSTFNISIVKNKSLMINVFLKVTYIKCLPRTTI